jgi:hypothetical protein
MYLPALARDMYKAQQEVEKLGQELKLATTVKEQEKVKDELRQANAELIQLKQIMEGRKEHSRVSLNKAKSRY